MMMHGLNDGSSAAVTLSAVSPLLSAAATVRAAARAALAAGLFLAMMKMNTSS